MGIETRAEGPECRTLPPTPPLERTLPPRQPGPPVPASFSLEQNATIDRGWRIAPEVRPILETPVRRVASATIARGAGRPRRTSPTSLSTPRTQGNRARDCGPPTGTPQLPPLRWRLAYRPSLSSAANI